MPLASALAGDWRTADPLIAAGVVDDADDGASDDDRRIVERASVELITGREARRRTAPAKSDVALTTGDPATTSGTASLPDHDEPADDDIAPATDAPPTATRAESLTERGDTPAATLGAAVVIGAETVDPLITRRSADAVCPLAGVSPVAPVAGVAVASLAMRITRDGGDTETRRAGASRTVRGRGAFGDRTAAGVSLLIARRTVLAAEETGLDPIRPEAADCETAEPAPARPDPVDPTRPTTGADAAAGGTDSGARAADAIGLTGTPRDTVEAGLAAASDRLTDVDATDPAAIRRGEPGAATASGLARSMGAESAPAGSTASAAMRRDTIDRPATGNDNTGDEIDGAESNASKAGGFVCAWRRTDPRDSDGVDGDDVGGGGVDGRAAPADPPAASAATRSDSGSERSITAAGTVSPDAVDTGRIGSADDCAVVDDEPAVFDPASDRRNAVAAAGTATAPNE